MVVDPFSSTRCAADMGRPYERQAQALIDRMRQSAADAQWSEWTTRSLSR
jgi:hypothetical protein